MPSNEAGNSGEKPAEVEGEIVDAPGAALVKAPSAALAADLRQAEAFRRQAKAGATERAYKADWKRFRAWAASRGLEPLPAAPGAVEAYVSWLAVEGYSIATIERFLAAGTHFHQAAGTDFPRNTPGVRRTLAGIRRSAAATGAKPSKKAALGLSVLSEACGRLHTIETGTPNAGRVLRDRAMLTVGWFCTLRSASLVAIRREHVRLVRFVGDEPIDELQAPEGLILHLPRSKTDQTGVGRDVAVLAQPDESVCPVRALAAYFTAVELAPEELIFPVSERTVSRLVKRLVANPAHGHKSLREIAACASCAAASSRFASHSLRRGSATKLARAGVPEREIMRHGGWKSERVMRGYIDDALLFENNPTKGLAQKKGAPE